MTRPATSTTSEQTPNAFAVTRERQHESRLASLNASSARSRQPENPNRGRASYTRTRSNLKTPRRYIIIYARRTKGGPIHIFHDSGMTKLFAIFELHHPQRPRHGSKWITLNCYLYRLEWLPDTNP